MTEKEKAKELVGKFWVNADGGFLNDKKKLTKSAINCAITSVDEVIGVLRYFNPDNAYRNDIKKSYWQEVKKELLILKEENK
jgi:hypothetical protein